MACANLARCGGWTPTQWNGFSAWRSRSNNCAVTSAISQIGSPSTRLLRVQGTATPPKPLLSPLQGVVSANLLHGFGHNWLRVFGTTELAQIDQRVCQQLHAIMPQLDTFKTEQESLEFILPGKGALDAHPQRMNGSVEQAFASALRGLAVTGILFDVGNHAGIENALPIVRGIKTTIEVQVGSTEIDTHLFGRLFQRLQALR